MTQLTLPGLELQPAKPRVRVTITLEDNVLSDGIRLEIQEQHLGPTGTAPTEAQEAAIDLVNMLYARAGS